MDQASTLLRDRRLSDLARAFIDGTEALTGPDPAAPASHPPPA